MCGSTQSGQAHEVGPERTLQAWTMQRPTESWKASVPENLYVACTSKCAGAWQGHRA